MWDLACLGAGIGAPGVHGFDRPSAPRIASKLQPAKHFTSTLPPSSVTERDGLWRRLRSAIRS